MNFPETGRSESEIFKRLFEIEQNLLLKLPNNLRSYGGIPLPISIKAASEFIALNPNNIGSHPSTKSAKSTQQLELETILAIGNLLNLDNPDGHLTQGGTESNITGLWIGRNYLKRTDKSEKICLIKTSLTHYSIDKGAELLQIEKDISIPLNEQYGMDSRYLESRIRDCFQHGYKKFLIVATLGYNITGTVDPIDEIDSITTLLENELGIETYIHVDAAIGGFILPFIDKNCFDFRLNSIKSFSLDMHKFGLVPNTCGIFLARNNLKKYIQREVPYLPHGIDDTFSGSRPGATAAAAWSTIHFLGRSGFEKIVRESIEMKNYFIERFKESNIINESISHPLMPLYAFSLKIGRLSKTIENKYRLLLVPLDLGFKSPSNFYFVIFPPGLLKSTINSFFEDLHK